MADDTPDNLPEPQPRPPVAERPAIAAGRFTSTPAQGGGAAGPGGETVEQLRGELLLLRRELAEVRGQVRQIWPHLFPRESAGGAIAFPVKLTQTGGSAGDSKTAASYTYTVKDLAGATLGLTIAPEWTRAEGKVTAATHGLAYRSPTAGTVVLAVAEEKPSMNGRLFEVALTQTGGSQGSTTASPSYTYTAVDADGATMGTSLSPAVRLWELGRVNAATSGIMFQSGGSVTLLLALEQRKNATC